MPIQAPSPDEKRSKIIYGFGPMPPKPKPKEPQGPKTEEGYFYPKKEKVPLYGKRKEPRAEPQGPVTEGGYFYPKQEMTPAEKQAEQLGVIEEYYHPLPPHLRPYEAAILSAPQGRQAAQIYYRGVARKEYREMEPREKFEYQLLYGSLQELPLEKYKEYEGGVEYLESLPLEERERLIQEYLTRHTETEIQQQPKRFNAVFVSTGERGCNIRSRDNL